MAAPITDACFWKGLVRSCIALSNCESSTGVEGDQRIFGEWRRGTGR
jgi:hypothetical protein